MFQGRFATNGNLTDQMAERATERLTHDNCIMYSDERGRERVVERERERSGVG